MVAAPCAPDPDYANIDYDNRRASAKFQHQTALLAPYRAVGRAFSGARFDGVRETRENLSGGARGLVLTVLTAGNQVRV